MDGRRDARRSSPRGWAMAMALPAVALLAWGCMDVSAPGSGGGGGGNPAEAGFTPSWIHASWSGGGGGAPNDRKSQDAAEWRGRLCPASSIEFLNHDGVVPGLSILNHCTLDVVLGLCATKGAQPQPEGGLQECAGPDAFQTPFSRLYLAFPPAGAVGRQVLPSTQNLSIQVFFCSDEQQMSGSPLRCY